MTRKLPSICCGLLLLSTGNAFTEDFKLSDGTVFKGVHVLEVRPDALVLSHERGVVMVDLEKLSKPLRSRYRYDPLKAVAYRTREAKAVQAAAAEKLALVTALEQRRMALAQLEAEASLAAATPGSSPDDLQLSAQAGARDRAYNAALAQIGAEFAQGEESRIAARGPKTFWTADVWHHPVVQLLGGLLGGGSSQSNGVPVLGGNGLPVDRRSNSVPQNWR